jgi:hypothetical protein
VPALRVGMADAGRGTGTLACAVSPAQPGVAVLRRRRSETASPPGDGHHAHASARSTLPAPSWAPPYRLSALSSGNVRPFFDRRERIDGRGGRRAATWHGRPRRHAGWRRPLLFEVCDFPKGFSPAAGCLKVYAQCTKPPTHRRRRPPRTEVCASLRSGQGFLVFSFEDPVEGKQHGHTLVPPAPSAITAFS